MCVRKREGEKARKQASEFPHSAGVDAATTTTTDDRRPRADARAKRLCVSSRSAGRKDRRSCSLHLLRARPLASSQGSPSACVCHILGIGRATNAQRSSLRPMRRPHLQTANSRQPTSEPSPVALPVTRQSGG